MSVMYDESQVQPRPAVLEEPGLSSTLPPPRPPVRQRRSSGGWILAAAIAAIILFGVGVESIPPGTPGHQLWINLTTPASAAVPPPAAQAQPQQAVDPRVAVIQQVIQRANDEQVQAIASGNPSVMSDTATPAHYQQLVRINQNLVTRGVTAIRLTNLSWGPITVNAHTATATSYETWVTTLSDSSTLQSTDTNVYTLVQQNGSWIIQDDQQPNAPTATSQPAQPAAPGAPGQSTRPSVPQPVQPAAGGAPAADTSHNWSGYAATGGTYTSVTGTWTVPRLSSTNRTPGVGATWVGIGGVNSRDLIQAGTQDVASAGGQSQYQAWIEMLPRASQQVPLVVSPGDSVTVSINEQGGNSGTWKIAFKNNTTGQTYQTTVQYASSHSSAEWIEEAPVGANGLLPLDNFGSISFSGATATRNGQSVSMTQAGAQPITMLNRQGQALAVPSAIGSDGSSFSVARTSAPATPSRLAAPSRG